MVTALPEPGARDAAGRTQGLMDGQGVRQDMGGPGCLASAPHLFPPRAGQDIKNARASAICRLVRTCDGSAPANLFGRLLSLPVFRRRRGCCRKVIQWLDEGFQFSAHHGVPESRLSGKARWLQGRLAHEAASPPGLCASPSGATPHRHSEPEGGASRCQALCQASSTGHPVGAARTPWSPGFRHFVEAAAPTGRGCAAGAPV